MIICDNCNVCVTKTTFCSPKCRVSFHRNKNKPHQIEEPIKSNVTPAYQYSPYTPKPSYATVTNEYKDDDGTPKPRANSTKRECPFCHKSIWTENSNKHYQKNHEGSQV